MLEQTFQSGAWPVSTPKAPPRATALTVAQLDQRLEAMEQRSTSASAGWRSCWRAFLGALRVEGRSAAPAAVQSAQFTSWSPSMRVNSLTLWLTTVALIARAWQAIQRSLAPIGVPRRFKAVA